jgi:flagellar hook-length control protein FliK
VAALKDTVSGAPQQVLESIQGALQQGQSRITIALNPPELGRVSVRFEEQDSQVIGVLEVSQKQTRAEIEQALPQLLQSLQESGVQIKRLDVMLDSQPDQGQAKGQSWNEASGSYSESQERQRQEDHAGADKLRDRDGMGLESHSTEGPDAEDPTLVGAGAINMLI